jgi:hypothetical protein
LQVAIDCVRRRAGEVIDPEHAREIHEHLARATLRRRAGAQRRCAADRRRRGGRRLASRTTAKVRELADLFGTRAAWAALQLGVAPQPRGGVSLRSPTTSRSATSDGLATASLRDLIYLFGDGYWKHSSLLTVLDRRSRRRRSVLLATAAELLASGLAPFRIDAAQVKPTPAPRGGSRR